MVDPVILNGITVDASRDVLADSREHVRLRMAAFLGRLPECWDSARVKLTVMQHRSLSWAVLAQANLEFKGQPIRAQVAARFVAEASRPLVRRLGEQLARLAQPLQGRPWPPHRPRPQPVDRPPDHRTITRAKSYPLTRCTAEHAALLMDTGDHDFYLFTDDLTGQDAVVYRVGPTGYRLALLDGLVPPSPRTVLPLSVSVHPVPRHTPDQAAARLGRTELAFQFFRNADTDRAAVLYRRYDGHYGLITPAERPMPPQPAMRAERIRYR